VHWTRAATSSTCDSEHLRRGRMTRQESRSTGIPGAATVADMCTIYAARYDGTALPHVRVTVEPTDEPPGGDAGHGEVATPNTDRAKTRASRRTPALSRR
jgi:hypothetical protein